MLPDSADYGFCTNGDCGLKNFCNRAEMHHSERLSKTIIPQSFTKFQPQKDGCDSFVWKLKFSHLTPKQ